MIIWLGDLLVKSRLALGSPGFRSVVCHHAKIALYTRPDQTRLKECPDWKAEWLVQPVFCIVDTGSCSFFLLTSTWRSRWQTHQTQADQTCGGNGNILTKLTTTNSLSLIISHKRSSSDHPRSRLACLRRGPSQLKPVHRCSWRSPSCSGWCLDWSRESRFHKMA